MTGYFDFQSQVKIFGTGRYIGWNVNEHWI